MQLTQSKMDLSEHSNKGQKSNMHHLHTRKQFKQWIKTQNSWSFVLQTSKSIRRLVQAPREILLNSEELWISRL